MLLGRLGKAPAVSWTRVIALELAAIALLGLGSLLAASTLVESEAGRGGGLIGWGILILLGYLLPPFWQGLLLAAAVLAFSWYRFRNFARISSSALRSGWSARNNAGARGGQAVATGEVPAPPCIPAPAAADSADPIQNEAPADAEPEFVRPREPSHPPSPALPPQFRKNLKPGPALKEKQNPPRAKREKGLPSIEIFEGGELSAPTIREINQIAGTIEKTLDEFGIPARVISFRTGPTVTQFGVEPGFVEKAGPDGEIRRAKVRVSQISSLANDLALALSAPTLRIEAPVPGQSYVGIEVPHRRSSLVRLRMVMQSAAFQKIRSPLAVALGLDVAGQPLCADLADDAPSAHRRDHRIRKVGVHYRDHRLPGGQQSARAAAPGDDRPEDGGTRALQRPAAHSRQGGNRARTDRLSAALVHARDGPALQTARGAARAPHRRLQPQSGRRAATGRPCRAWSCCWTRWPT